ncbi:hypothetical protein ACROYT_G036867 [Oculina patagonica]
MKHILLRKVKECILICCFLSILVFKSSQAAEPVNITEWEGSISSPDYPFTYPPNSSLTWIKSVSPGNRVKITIFDLQTTCDTDYLEIRDGDSMASPLIARYCGTPGFTQITSSGTHLLLHFASDDIIDASQRGFQLQHAGDCKVHTNQTSGIITPPNYPNNYPNYMDCLWTIQLHPAMQITLECDEIALEYKEGCIFDFIEILAGPSPDSPVMGRYCGVLNHSLTFERDGNMSIRFISDRDKEFHGFRCAYNIFKVRGFWTQWTSWTECSQTCRHGNQTRSRSCVNPLPDSGLELICGDVADTERRSCLMSNCTPVDGGYTSWSNWSACHVTCGTGVRNRSRNCTNPPPAFAGKNCSEIGEPWETTECVLATCPGETSSWSGSNHSSSTTLPSTTTPSSHSDVILPSSQASVALSINQFRVTTLSSNQSDPIVPSAGYSVTPSSSQFRVTLSLSHSHVTLSGQPPVTLSSSPTGVTLSSNQFGFTLSSIQFHGTLLPSQSRTTHSSSQYQGALSPSQFHGTPSSALPTPQEGVQNTDSVGGTTYMYSTLEGFQMLSSSFLSDRTIHRTNNTNSARKTSISTLVWHPTLSNFKTQSLPREDTVHASGKPGLTLVSYTSSITSGYSASLISRSILQLHQSVESSHTVYASNGNSFQDNIGLSLKTSASLQSSLSVSGDLPLSQMKLSSNLTNPTHEDSIVTDAPVNSAAISSLHQESIQKTQYTSLHSLAYMHNQTGPAGIAPHATDSTSSTSKASSLDSHHNGSSSWESGNYHIHSNSKSSIRNAYFSASVGDTSTNTLAFSSIPSWNKSIIATVGFVEKTIMISTNFSSLSRTSDYSTTLTAGSTLHGKHSIVLNPSNEINSLPTSFTTYATLMTIHSFTESHQQHVTSIYVQATTTRATSTCCGSSTMFASHDSVMHQTHGQSTHDSSKTLQTDSLATVKETYRAFIDPTLGQTSGQSLYDSFKTLQVHSPRTSQPTSSYSVSIDHTHGQSIHDSLKTLQTDSLRAVKGTYSASTDHTNGQSTHDTLKTIPTDSLKTAKGATTFSAPMNLGSLVVIDKSERASSSEEQLGSSTFQVRPSLSSLSPTLSPSSSVPSYPTDDPVTTPALQFPWHLVPFLVIIFVIAVVLITYYLHVPDIVETIILAIKEKRRQMKASKPDNASLDLTKGNFSTEGLKTSHFHSYQREVFYEEALNYAFFETEATKAIEFSVHLDDEKEQSSGSEESVEISCEMGEETAARKQENDTLRKMFDNSGTDNASKQNVEGNFRTAESRRNRIIYLHDSPASYEI